MASYKTYRKRTIVEAKLFEPGDEDGFTIPDNYLFGCVLEDVKNKLPPEKIPYISTLENQEFKGHFYKNYICIGINNERWLVYKNIFETTYEQINGK